MGHHSALQMGVGRREMYGKAAACAAFGMLLSGIALAQVSSAPATHSGSAVIAAPVKAESTGAESLGADDLLELMVSYCPELSHNFRVGTDGRLSLPLLHQTLAVSGLTPAQVAESLRRALIEEHVLTEPVVNVSVVEYRSRPVSVVGAVNHPITFQATGRTTLIDAIAKAEGLSPSAGGTIIVTSSHPAAGANSVRTIPVSDLIGGTVPGANMKLEGGEEIRIPDGNKIFVAGNVRKPGMYAMQSDSDTTVVKAIALSSGLEAYSTSVAYIYRKTSTGTARDELKIPLGKILSHHAPDVAMLADDILYVPTSDGKKITSRVLNQLAGFGQSAGAYAVIR